METKFLLILVLWGVYILNLFGISKEVADAVYRGTGKVFGGVLIGVGLGIWAIWRMNVVFLFADRLDTAVFWAIILTLGWTLISWLYCRRRNA